MEAKVTTQVTHSITLEMSDAESAMLIMLLANEYPADMKVDGFRIHLRKSIIQGVAHAKR